MKFSASWGHFTQRFLEIGPFFSLMPGCGIFQEPCLIESLLSSGCGYSHVTA